jgi:hypothetical protein
MKEGARSEPDAKGDEKKEKVMCFCCGEDILADDRSNDETRGSYGCGNCLKSFCYHCSESCWSFEQCKDCNFDKEAAKRKEEADNDDVERAPQIHQPCFKKYAEKDVPTPNLYFPALWESM